MAVLRGFGAADECGVDDSKRPMKQVSTFYGMWTPGVFSFMKSQALN